MASALAVSVVVPTYNRRERLVRCLEALSRQTLARERFEVVVASDGSTDGTVEAARAAGQRLGLALHAVDATHGGPAHARNAGVREARAPVVAFTDDDVLPEPAWLEAGLAAFDAPQVGGVEGKTLAEGNPQSLFRLNVANLAGGLYVTCNIFYRRDVLESVGLFDEQFVWSLEDTDLAWRVLDAGYRIPFAPAAVVVHRPIVLKVTAPLAVSSHLSDHLRLWQKHPQRPRGRPLVYRSDVVKLLLLAGAAGLAAAGARAAAAAAAAGFLLLVLRTMAREVVWPRALRPDVFVRLVAVYSLLPLADAFHALRGLLRVRTSA